MLISEPLIFKKMTENEMKNISFQTEDFIASIWGLRQKLKIFTKHNFKGESTGSMLIL